MRTKKIASEIYWPLDPNLFQSSFRFANFLCQLVLQVKWHHITFTTSWHFKFSKNQAGLVYTIVGLKPPNEMAVRISFPNNQQMSSFVSQCTRPLSHTAADDWALKIWKCPLRIIAHTYPVLLNPRFVSLGASLTSTYIGMYLCYKGIPNSLTIHEPTILMFFVIRWGMI